MCRMRSLYFETIHVPCFVSAVFLLRRLYFATKVRHVQAVPGCVAYLKEVKMEGAYVRNNSNDSLQAIFTAFDFVLLPTLNSFF